MVYNVVYDTDEGGRKMEELNNSKLQQKINAIYKNILKLKKVEVDNNYCAKLLDWFNEVICKNIAIYNSKKDEEAVDQELYKKERQHVYWIDFGRNIGSEFCDCHFAIVIFESKYTALVIPLTSKKEHSPAWIEENKDCLVDLGVIEGYPKESKECYACVFMAQSVSKKRLSRYGDKKTGEYFDIKLSNQQMEAVCNKLADITYNKIR